MSIDPSIRAGDILTLLLVGIGGLGFLWSMRGELKMLAKDVRMHSQKIENLQTVITTLAVQNQRMNDLDRRIEELRHGRGFIKADINGVYERDGKTQPLP